MDIDKLIELFGKEYRDKKLVDFFKENGFDVVKSVQEWMKTKYYKGAESSTYAENINRGYSLHFSDELDYFNAEDGKYGESGRYYFTSVYFYSDGADGYHQYEGELVNGIRITDTRDEIRALMEKPYKGHDFLDRDKWEDVNGCIVSVNYKGDETPFNICIYLDKNN